MPRSGPSASSPTCGGSPSGLDWLLPWPGLSFGPVPDYLGAAETGVPDGTRLAVDAVAVEGGVATVVLTSAATSADVGRRAQMWAQFVATLTQAAGVSVGSPGGPGVRSAVAAGGPLAGRFGAGPRVLHRRDRTDPGTGAARRPVGAGGPDAIGRGQYGARGRPARAAHGRGRRRCAGNLGRLHRSRWPEFLRSGALARPRSGACRRAGNGPRPPPAYDSRGRLWVGGQSSTGQVWTLDAAASGSAAESVDAPWLGTRAVLALAPSGDGTRLAVVSRGADPTDTQLDVAGIVRDPTGRPTALAKGYRQGEPLRRISSVTWVGDLTLAVLAVDADGGQVRPYVVDVGQGVGLRRRGIADPRDTLVAPVDGARRVVSTGGLRGLVIVTDEPRVKARSGGGWRVVGSASDLLMPPSRPS